MATLSILMDFGHTYLYHICNDKQLPLDFPVVVCKGTSETKA